MSARGKSLAFTDEEIDELAEMRYADKRTFSLLSLVFTHLDLRHHFHIDHFFPKSRFTPAQLRSEEFSEEEASALREMAGLPAEPPAFGWCREPGEALEATGCVARHL